MGGMPPIAHIVASMLLIVVGTTYAQATPQVTSFTITPEQISNNYAILLSWDIANGTGNRAYFSCPPGVAIYRADTNVSFPCNIRSAIDSNQTGTAGFKVINVSGTTKNVSVTLYPKDSSGADYDGGARNASFSVGTSPQPIIDFTAATTTIPGEIALTWKGVDITKSNMSFDCTHGVTIYSKNPLIVNALKCGEPAFPTDLAQSGTVIITTSNSIGSPVEVTARMLPAIETSSYDATHARTTTFSAPAKSAVIDPSVVTFKSAAAQVASGAPFTLSWTTMNAASSTLQFTCDDNLTFHSLAADGTTTKKLFCDRPAFVPGLPGNASTTIIIINLGAYAVNARIALFPASADGTFFGTKAKSIIVSVLPKTGALPVGQSPVNPVAQNLQIAGAPVGKRHTFTLPLKPGSQNEDVRQLQIFLAQNPLIYSEAKVTGFYGPATSRAVGRFQEKYGIAKKGDEGYGNVGPKTRAKLNSLTTP